MKVNTRLLLIAFSCLILPTVTAKVSLPDIIGSHMVLQRDQPIPIWGKAASGEKIQVRFNGQNLSAVADEQGNWKIFLAPMEANSSPQSMLISGENILQLEDILIGEVWLCAGQSNMQWTVAQSTGGAEAMAAAENPQIRLFNVSREVAFKKKTGKLASWERCSPQTVAEFSGVGYFFALELYQQQGIPVGMLNASYGGSLCEAWIPREYIAASEELSPCLEREKTWLAERPQVTLDYRQQLADWEEAAKKAEAEGGKAPRRPRVPSAMRDYYLSGAIYRNMVEPLVPYRIRGILWYQGEQNEERAEQYELLLTTLIQAWRERWDQGEIPFAIVQLPNFRAVSPEPTDLAWSRLRDSQRKAFLKTSNTGLIVTIDLGEADDIHPPNKLDVAKRLFRWAQADVYDQPGTKSGPLFSKVKFKRGKAVLHFTETGTGLKSRDGQALEEFAISGPDQQWFWAKAQIKGKNKVLVWSEDVPQPEAVRYAFNNNPANPNLSNETGIPACPFRTDDWPGPTAGKR